jgi:HAD superfamily hydrolase (TIGR01509 family)
MKHVEAVLFDIDDTLFDRRGAQDLVLDIIVKEHAALFDGLDMEEVRRAFAESDEITSRENDEGTLQEGYRARRTKLFLETLRLDLSFWKDIDALYAKRLPTVDAPVPGVRRVIEELAKGFKLGVVSNGFPDVQYGKLDNLGIRDRFGCIVLSEEVGVNKPDPGIFKYAASLLNIQPSACLYVGDSFNIDIVGAKGAGMLACWFNPSGAPRPRQDIVPDVEIRRLDALPRIVRAQFAQAHMPTRVAD